jgi:hypothetical protein
MPDFHLESIKLLINQFRYLEANKFGTLGVQLALEVVAVVILRNFYLIKILREIISKTDKSDHLIILQSYFSRQRFGGETFSIS